MPRLQEALRDSDALAQAWFRMRAGDVQGARRDLQTLVRNDRRNPDALHLLGMAAAASGKKALAVRSLTKSLRVRPDGWVGIHLVTVHLDAGRVRRADRLVRRLEESLSTDMQVRQARAYVLVYQGKLLAARNRLQSLEVDEASAAAAAQLAALLGELGEHDEAVEALERAVERAPEDPGYRRRYFEALLLARDWSGLASASGAPGAAVAGGGLDLYYGGLALMRLDRRSEAIMQLSSLVDHAGPDPRALAGSAALLFQLEAWAESESLGRLLLETETEAHGAHHLLAMSLSRQERESEAVAHYRRAADLESEDANARFDLLVSLCNLERREELEDRMPRALRDFDEDPRFKRLAAQCLPEVDD